MAGLRLAILLLLAAPLAAEEGWQPMTGAEIEAALTGQVLDYPQAWQDFRTSGRTLYNAGRDSWGYWAVREDQYCSQWPPSDLWTCYDMTRQGDLLRFIDASGEVTEGRLRD